MKQIKQAIYIVWQYVVALPILIVLTLFTAIFTIVFVHWHNARFVWRVQSFWAKCVCWFFLIPVSVSGLEHIDKNQSYVCVSNHQSFFDIFVIYGWLPIIFKWLMKQELRKIPFVGTACKAAGHIFINRTNAIEAKHSLDKAKETLQGGVSMVIFPEGTRTRTGEMGRFKRGAFAIATELELPVLPISLTGCFDIMPKGRFYAKPGHIHMHIGEPVNIAGMTNDEAIETVRNAVSAGM